MQEEFSNFRKFFSEHFPPIFCAEGVAELSDFIYNGSERVLDAKTKDARPSRREKEKRYA